MEKGGQAEGAVAAEGDFGGFHIRDEHNLMDV